MAGLFRDAPKLEDPRHIAQAGVGVQVGLGMGVTDAAQDIGPQRGAQRTGQFAGNDLCLVVAAMPLARPVQGDGHHQVDIGKVGAGSQISAQLGGEKPPGRQIPAILQGLGNLLVGILVVVEKQRRSIHVGHGGGIGPLTFQQRIQLIGHRIMLPLPEIGERKIGRAGYAQVILLRTQLPSAHQTAARHQQVCQFP